MLLRFRLDKTAKASTRVTQRCCNIACAWCHHDYFLHNGLFAINNDQFCEAITKILSATSAEQAHIRLAGDGDPTIVGKDELIDLISKLRAIPQIKTIKMTTNGILLGAMALDLHNAGIDSVTVSLNSLNQQGYQRYAGYDYLDKVLASIESVFNIGIALKINVIYCGWNEDEVDAFESLSCHYNGMPIKVFDLIVHSDRDRELFRPLEDLEKKLISKAHSIEEENSPYSRRIYLLKSGAKFIVKTAGENNNCPNLSCSFRSRCLEGCRNSIRIGLDGTMQPCGVRTDNKLNILESSITDKVIWDALHSGGKVGYESLSLINFG